MCDYKNTYQIVSNDSLTSNQKQCYNMTAVEMILCYQMYSLLCVHRYRGGGGGRGRRLIVVDRGSRPELEEGDSDNQSPDRQPARDPIHPGLGPRERKRIDSSI